MFNKVSKLSSSISRYSNYCEGYFSTNNQVDGYILCAFQGIGKAKVKYEHSGSDVLDGINAFDLAEVDGAYIGQINMITVSSFCGPQGLIWGYDFAVPNDLYTFKTMDGFPSIVRDKGRKVPVYSARPLIQATEKLFGNVNNKKFPIKPGSHVPCAGKNIKVSGPARAYSALAIGIADDREKDACLLMEDVGVIPYELKGKELVGYENSIAKNIAESIIEVGRNQKVKYKEIFVSVKSGEVNKSEKVCALVACPYINIARNAILKDSNGNFDFDGTINSDLKTWLKKSR